ncbi:MAG: hypothetical protein R2940_13310 [Syntrophotaleaceae bacterium]
MKTITIGNLPGFFCTSFENGNVLCYWKGDLEGTLLHFFLISSNDTIVNNGKITVLATLQFDFFIKDMKKAQVLAKGSWKKYREHILLADGERLDARDLKRR